MLLDTLVKEKIVAEREVSTIRSEIEKAGGDEERVLLQRGVRFEDILKAKSAESGIPLSSLEGVDVPMEVLHFIPEESAVHYGVVPLRLREGVLHIGILDPLNFEALDAVNFLAAKEHIPYKLFIIPKKDFDRIVSSYKGLSSEISESLSELETELAMEERKLSDLVEKKGEGRVMETRVIEDAPVTKIVATIIHYAVAGDASDIHVEPLDDKVRVRFRVDGVLNTSLLLPIKLHSAVVARIKILSNIRLDEKRKPQDGRFSARIEGRRVDFRVSTLPVYFGEKVMMRILDHEKGLKKLEALGLSERNIKIIREILKRPFGLILISGPTGSGKTTTLYAMLNEINRETQNVLSLEDPVEYNISGMNQSQVRPEIGYTFATGLRHSLRQDPDIIMVGEIRDRETAALAVQAALTGHLVFSTIHTNNATGVIPRLIDMGVDPYLIAPTLILAMAQRLVTVLCPGAGKPIPIEGSIKVMVEKEFEDLPENVRKELPLHGKLYGKSPTSDCPKGTRGRIAVFEVFQMDNDLEEVLLKRPSEVDIKKIVSKQGMLTMKEDAILKCMAQIVPFEDVNKL